ncbi:hypothetical protein MTO96_002212 [Rhipicephalus appendiculatus]
MYPEVVDEEKLEVAASSFGCHEQVAILQDASKPSRTLGSSHVLHHWPGHQLHRDKSTLEVPQVGDEGEIEVVVVLRSRESSNTHSTFSRTPSLSCADNLLRDMLPLYVPRVGNEEEEVAVEVVIDVLRFKREARRRLPVRQQNVPGLFDLLTTRLQEADQDERQ